MYETMSVYWMASAKNTNESELYNVMVQEDCKIKPKAQEL